MIAEGSNGSIKLEEDSVKITRKGIANFLTQGLQGEKVIPVHSIKAIQFKEAGKWMAGFIQFTTIGSIERRGGMLEATKDENAVLFERSQQASFEILRRIIEDKMRDAEQPISRADSTAEELERLANLVERGFLTRDEFEKKKADILQR